MIKVLFEGVHTNAYFRGYYEIDPLSSSVTLIQRKGKNILIDSGSVSFRAVLMQKLAEHGLKAEDIHYVCNTHFHFDHCANNPFFPNAEIFSGRSRLINKTGKAIIYSDVSLMPYPEGVEMFMAPGHTMDHAVYRYSENGVRFVCAGDALREDIIRSQKVPLMHSQADYVPSMKRIFEMADVLIPGHGRVIDGKVKEELYGLVCGAWTLSSTIEPYENKNSKG